jgi:fructose/tagatose bisphosphate aldolase
MHQPLDTLLEHLNGAVEVDGDSVKVTSEEKLREGIDHLVYRAVFGEGLEREQARWLIWEAGQQIGIVPASAHELYMAVGSGEVPANFTVPAMNIRGMTYDSGRAVFRAAKKLDVGALILEIARSEMGYTDQRPTEYVASLMAAAIKEGFRGPLFIQGDHFQVSHKNFTADPDREVSAVKDLIKEAVSAGFYNIDIDTSTLVNLDYEELDEQQRANYELCAQLTEYVREIEPEGVTVSLGGEIGEVGGHNSTVEELHAFMRGYNRTLDDIYPDLQGISKISVQTGTSHGGVVLPDGTLADVAVDFDTLQELSRVAREEYSIGGAVQHGASTLPAEAFDRFPEIGTLEIHLATGFQNIMFDNAPEELVEASYDHIRTHNKDEQKEGQTDEQFLYSTRKKALGPLKQQWWDLDDEAKSRICGALQEQFEFLFEKLNVKGTREVVNQVTTMWKTHRPLPQQAQELRDLELASDLAD